MPCIVPTPQDVCHTVSLKSYFPSDLAQDTVYRRWTEPSETQSPQNVYVAGLAEALNDAGLSSYTSVAVKWCEEMGAAFLDEVLEELDTICAILAPPDSGGLDKVKRFTLYMALHKHCSR
mmetsp:Transcript_36506/g.97219  ORF Transcript_36506/g.97219 Transcript_36506/m.97219 type:complete len:120 (-) Transcript_36506:241-600(-)